MKNKKYEDVGKEHQKTVFAFYRKWGTVIFISVDCQTECADSIYITIFPTFL